MERNSAVLALRPLVVTDLTVDSLPLERFQNQTLRPILKFQHNAMIQYFTFYFDGKYMPLQTEQRELFVKKVLQNDKNLRVFYIGMVVGLFTHDEFCFYNQHQTELNKRIIQMLAQRISSAI